MILIERWTYISTGGHVFDAEIYLFTTNSAPNPIFSYDPANFPLPRNGPAQPY